MELCRPENLSKWLEEREPQLDVDKMCREMLEAVKYLHAKVVISQPSNVLLQ